MVPVVYQRLVNFAAMLDKRVKQSTFTEDVYQRLLGDALNQTATHRYPHYHVWLLFRTTD